MNGHQRYDVGEELAGERLDRCLTSLCPDQSRSYIQRLIDDGLVLLNERKPRRKTTVQAGDAITVEWPDDSVPDLVPESFAVPILYEDDDLLVLNKPPGMTVHPGAGTQGGTLVHALLGYNFDEFKAQIEDEHQPRPGIVHRLDKDTSGAIIVARRAPIRRQLSAQFAAREVEKTYLALVAGQPPTNRRIVTFIARHPTKRKKMAVVKDSGKRAVTHLRTRAIQGQRALVELGLETGRTHQIRVHLAHLEAPILGDEVYGRRFVKEAPRQMLHAWRLAFAHPISGERLTIIAPPPEDFCQTASELGLALPEEEA